MNVCQTKLFLNKLGKLEKYNWGASLVSACFLLRGEEESERLGSPVSVFGAWWGSGRSLRSGPAEQAGCFFMTHLFMGGDGGPQPYIAALPPLPSAEGGAGTSRETVWRAGWGTSFLRVFTPVHSWWPEILGALSFRAGWVSVAQKQEELRGVASSPQSRGSQVGAFSPKLTGLRDK